MKFLALFIFLSISLSSWSQVEDLSAVQKMNYGDSEIQYLLKDERLAICLYEFFEKGVGDFKVLKRTINGAITNSTFYRIRGLDYYKSHAFKKHFVDLIIQRDVLVGNEKEILFKCTVNK